MFARAGGPDWLLFSAGRSDVYQLVFTMASRSTDATRIANATGKARTNRLDLGLTQLGTGTMSTSRLATYPLHSFIAWQSTGAVALPYGTAPAGAPPSLRLWLLPDAVRGLADPATRSIDPPMRVCLARYDEATGGTAQDDVDYYGWCTLLDFTIRRIADPGSSSVTPNTYEIVGASGNDVTLLERLLEQVQGNDAFFDQVIVGYAPSSPNGSARGVETDPRSGVTLGIAQVNLARETRPSVDAAAGVLPAVPPAGIGLLNTRSAFARLLWKASITRDGGFYLYYYDAVGARGLPGRIFNDKNEATLTLILLYAKPEAVLAQNRVTNFMSAVATGISNAVVYIEAAPPSSPPQTIPAPSGKTLSELGFAYFTDVAALAQANATVPLTAGALINVTRGLFPAPPGGIALAQIAARFGTTVAALQQANPAWKGSIPDPLPFPGALRLPALSLTVGTSVHTSSLGDIASFYGEDLTALAADNDDTPDVFAVGQTLTILGGPRVRAAVVPPGVEAVVASRAVTVGPLDQAPVLTGHMDPLLGLSQWPSVAASWRVLPPATAPQLVLQLLFDDSSYHGMLVARATGATTIVATFTEPLDPATATNPTNYTLDPAVDVQSAELDQAQVTVTLTVGTLSSNTSYSLRANGVKTADDETSFDERAGFVYPDDPEQRTSTISDNAARDLKVYSRLSDQLTEPNGIALSVESSLLGDRLALSPAQVTDLLAWLFVGSGTTGSIYAFLVDRAAFGTKATLPPAGQPVSFALQQSQINTAQIFELSLDFLVARTGAAVPGELETASGIRQAQTRVAPYQTGVATGQETLRLTQFARDFEEALSQADDRLTVATGVDRAASSANPGATLWAVRLGLTAGQAISFAIDDDSKGKPAIFAPRPISPVLASQPWVPIYDYTTGNGLSPTPSRSIDFNGIDMDVWGLALFEAIDGVLTPRYTAPIQIVGHYSNGTDFLQQILDAKRDLATIVKLWMIPVYADERADPAQAQEYFYQQLLVRLSNAYSVRACLQFEASVTASVTGPLDHEPPRLCGSVVILGPTFEAATADRGDLTVVNVQFSDVMNQTMATDVANYTFDGGISVQSASLSSDGTMVSLTVSKVVTPGQTSVTASPAISSARREPLVAPYRRTITIGGLLQPRSTMVFTSPKLSLLTGPERPLAFLLSAPAIVTGGGGEVVSVVDLPLAFNGTNIEHQIGTVSGIDGYQASSWLSFVILDADWPLAASLGSIQVPMVQRAFPAMPEMTGQDGDATNPNPTTVQQLTRWDYSFTYSLAFHYPQDRVHAAVNFNQRQNPMMAQGLEDAFNQLAQFVTVFPDVCTDFDGILATIDATVDPIKDTQKITNAAIAIGAFVDMLQEIIAAARHAGPIRPRQPRPFVGDASLTYAFQVDEDEVQQGATQSALLVTVSGTPPSGVGTPIVKVDDTDYEPVLITNATERFGYVFRKRGTTDEYLTVVQGQTIGPRTVVLPALDLFQRGHARSTVCLKRNEKLAGQAVADPFVYTTPDLSFATPLHPTIDSHLEFAIEDIDGSSLSTGNPHTRSLAEHLAALFGALLAVNTQSTLTIRIEATYAYSLNTGPTPVAVPVFMQAPLDVDVRPAGSASSDSAGDAAEKLTAMIAAWTLAIEKWFAEYVPTAGGTLWFDLAIMSKLTTTRVPSLRVRRLSLGTRYVQPSLSPPKTP